MATTLSIATGPLTASRIFTNDAAAQAILIRFADRIGATGTNQQKLQAIVDWLVRRIQEEAAAHQMSADLEAVRESIRAANQLE